MNTTEKDIWKSFDDLSFLLILNSGCYIKEGVNLWIRMAVIPIF